jgi:hypothetical protein
MGSTFAACRQIVRATYSARAATGDPVTPEAPSSGTAAPAGSVPGDHAMTMMTRTPDQNCFSSRSI